MNKQEKKKNLGALLPIFIVMIAATGGIGFIFLLPFLIVAAIIYTSKKKAAENGEERANSMFELKKFQERLSSLENEKNLYSENEQRHLHTMRGSHSEYEHFMNELDDLFNAGIIEKDEYRERVARLKAEHRM